MCLPVGPPRSLPGGMRGGGPGRRGRCRRRGGSALQGSEGRGATARRRRSRGRCGLHGRRRPLPGWGSSTLRRKRAAALPLRRLFGGVRRRRGSRWRRRADARRRGLDSLPSRPPVAAPRATVGRRSGGGSHEIVRLPRIGCSPRPAPKRRPGGVPVALDPPDGPGSILGRCRHAERQCCGTPFASEGCHARSAVCARARKRHERDEPVMRLTRGVGLWTRRKFRGRCACSSGKVTGGEPDLYALPVTFAAQKATGSSGEARFFCPDNPLNFAGCGDETDERPWLKNCYGSLHARSGRRATERWATPSYRGLGVVGSEAAGRGGRDV